MLKSTHGILSQYFFEIQFNFIGISKKFIITHKRIKTFITNSWLKYQTQP